MTIARWGTVLIALILTATSVLSQSSAAVPKITDLFSADEVKKAGLAKLTPDEIAALNLAFFRVLMELNSKSESAIAPGTTDESEHDDVDFYDSRGRAVAYIAGDSDLTIYLWTGEPTAYLDDDSVFGFNGKHLGWFKGGAIYDHDGNVVAAVAERFKGTLATPPVKAFKQFVPFKAFEEFKPFKPFFRTQWSETPARIFFLSDVK